VGRSKKGAGAQQGGTAYKRRQGYPLKVQKDERTKLKNQKIKRIFGKKVEYFNVSVGFGKTNDF
jgi:hypothetical protein